MYAYLDAWPMVYRSQTLGAIRDRIGIPGCVRDVYAILSSCAVEGAGEVECARLTESSAGAICERGHGCWQPRSTMPSKRSGSIVSAVCISPQR